MRKIILYSLGVLLVAIVANFLLQKGIYPIASVNKKIIPQEEFKLSYAAALKYYEAAIRTYGQSPDDFDRDAFATELQKVTLDSLIEQHLIHQGLVAAYGENQVVQLVEEQLKNASSSEALSDEVVTIYGISLDVFKDIVLIPAAERDILSEALKKEGVEFSVWLAQVRAEAKVNIFMDGYQWKDGQVVRSS